MKRLTGFFFLLLFVSTAQSQIAEGRYYIQLANGRALEAESGNFKINGARTQIWLLYHGLNQLWEVRRVAGETNKYYILNVGSNRALDAAAPNVNTNGCRVQLWQHYPANRNQQWIIQAGTGGKYTVRCAASTSNKVLDVTGGVIDRGGAAIQLWDNLNGPNQLWRFTRSYDSAVVRDNFVDLRLNQSALKHQAPVMERGSCTFFGNIAALEAAYKKRGYGELDLSEEFFATMAKVLYIHPYWNDISTSNYRENQLGGLQGGGNMTWFTEGLRLPLETDMPFKERFDVPAYWDTRDQRLASDFNTTLLTNNVLKARTYYGALTAAKLSETQKRNSAEYERLLDLGYEVDVDLSIAHNYLVVGYDKTNPSAPVFLVKDSYERRGTRCITDCNQVPYATLMGMVDAAGYITGIREPVAFPELAFLGRWKLDFDGHKGTMDIYHIPGINGSPLLTSNGGTAVADKRIGVFYDESGNAFRVNGRMQGKRIEFHFDISTPNQRWDDLKGRKFIYYLNSEVDIMTGFHWDALDKSFGGYATKASSYITHAAAPGNIRSLVGTNWAMKWGERSGSVSCTAGGDATRADGIFTEGASILPFSIWNDVRIPGLLNIQLGTNRMQGRFLNHEEGIICGYDNAQGKIVMLYKR